MSCTGHQVRPGWQYLRRALRTPGTPDAANLMHGEAKPSVSASSGRYIRKDQDIEALTGIIAARLVEVDGSGRPQAMVMLRAVKSGRCNFGKPL